MYNEKEIEYINNRYLGKCLYCKYKDGNHCKSTPIRGGSCWEWREEYKDDDKRDSR